MGHLSYLGLMWLTRVYRVNTPLSRGSAHSLFGLYSSIVGLGGGLQCFYVLIWRDSQLL